METLRLGTNEKDLLRAGGIIRGGGLVAFPTETVYGLGADALDAEAVRSVYEAKGRPSDNPMIVHIADTTGLFELIKGGRSAVTQDVSRLITRLWPGPLTMVLPKSDKVPDVTTGGLDSVAVRMPSNVTARRLIKAAGRPVAAPSANLSGKPSPTSAEDVLEDMDGRIDAVVMGEDCSVGIESTVLDMTGEAPVILRPGAVTRELLTEILGREVRYDGSLLRSHKELPAAGPAEGEAEADTAFRPKSPGMKYRHYSPDARVRIIEGSKEEFREKAGELGLEAWQSGCRVAVIDYDDDEEKAARRLFADLRELDRQGYDLILIRALADTGMGFSVMNRMLRSAGFDIVK